MDPYQTKPQLSFDILGLVFSHYAEKENIQHPLETLLLVCRSWSNAALGHRALWNNFRITIGHEPTASMWSARLPLRLARRAPDAPLDIMLRNVLDLPYEKCSDLFTGASTGTDEWCYPCGVKHSFSGALVPCRCYDAARACIDSCLKLLTGGNGELCYRWRSFQLMLGDVSREKQSSKQVKDTLRYSTPILSSLLLWGLLCSPSADPGSQLFPDTRGLKHFTLMDCDLPSLPDFRNTERAEVGFTDLFYLDNTRSSFPLWTSLQRLSLWISIEVGIEVPSQLNELRILNLIIDLEEFPSGLLTCKMPQLTTLSIAFDKYRILEELTQCQGIDWSKLRVLRLNAGHVYRERGMYPTVPHSLVELLTRACNLEYFYASKGTMAVVIGILESARDGESSTPVASGEPRGTLLRGACLVNLYDNSIIEEIFSSSSLFNGDAPN